jgi:hypothetical protein
VETSGNSVKKKHTFELVALRMTASPVDNLSARRSSTWRKTRLEVRFGSLVPPISTLNVFDILSWKADRPRASLPSQDLCNRYGCEAGSDDNWFYWARSTLVIQWVSRRFILSQRVHTVVSFESDYCTGSAGIEKPAIDAPATWYRYSSSSKYTRALGYSFVNENFSLFYSITANGCS